MDWNTNVQRRKQMKGKISRMMMLLAIVTLSGCCVHRPTAETVAGLPVVKFGDQVPEGKDFILLMPAGQPITTDVSIKGSALAQEAQEKLTVKLKKDIYLYREWASFDRVRWSPGNQLVDFRLWITVPSWDHPSPGSIKTTFDLR
jgi:hypothetical protein